MVSLLCHCCVDKPLVSLPVHRVFGCRFLVNPLTYRYSEKNSSKYSQLEGGFKAFKFSPLSMSGQEKILFNTAFYMANYRDSSWEQANVPLHMYFPDDEDTDNFYYKLGANFLTPFGKDKMFEFPSASEISSYLVPDLLFDSPTSDYFYFFISCDLDFNKCNSELDFSDANCYNSVSPFFFVPGVPSIFTYSGVDFERQLRLPYHSQFFNLCSRGFVYDFSDFYSIFQQGFLSAYSKFLNDVLNCNYHKSYFSVFRFSKKDYYAYIQNNSTTR
jgi:hypothetical protein